MLWFPLAKEPCLWHRPEKTSSFINFFKISCIFFLLMYYFYNKKKKGDKEMKASMSTCRHRLMYRAHAKGSRATTGLLRECRWCRSALSARPDERCGAWFWPPPLQRAQRGHLMRENILSNYTLISISLCSPLSLSWPWSILIFFHVFFFFLQVKSSEACFSFSSFFFCFCFFVFCFFPHSEWELLSRK